MKRKRAQRPYGLVQRHLPGLILGTIPRIVEDLGGPYQAKPGLGGRQFLWRKGDRGTIDAIPKKDAEKIYNYVKKKIREAKEAPGKRQAAEKPKSTDDLLAIVRERYARGEINKEEFTTLSKDRTGQGS